MRTDHSETHAQPDSPPPPLPMPHFEWVDDAQGLARLLGAIGDTPATFPGVAIDTEADSMHHYREKVCLVQITLGADHWLVDPLADGMDLAPLIRILEKRPLVLHGADYDLRMLGRAYAFRPMRIFDTMLAAQLLGLAEIGLAAMVSRVAGIALSKHGQRADWSIRPLPDDLLAYAVDDTRYLARVAETLAAELRAKGRLEWLEESCERLLAATADCDPADRDLEDAWRIKGCRKLSGRPGALLRELWRWRESVAQRYDRPPFRIAPNQLLQEWANWLAANPDATVDQIPDRPAWMRGGRLEGFEAAIARGMQLPRSEWPRPPAKNGHGRRLTQDDEEKIKTLLKARDAVAAELEIQPGVLGPREAITKLVPGSVENEKILQERSGLMRWQAQVLAPALVPLLGK